jgi:hypothetical protein
MEDFIDDTPSISMGIRSMPMSMVGMKKPQFSSAVINQKEKYNWLIHVLFIRQEYDQCMKIID